MIPIPGTAPLTGTPYALLPDPPNVEQAGKPGFEHLEKYAIPRFASVSARNLAFSSVTEEEGMVVYVSGIGYQTWDGSAWVSFARLAGIPEVRTARKTANEARTSTTPTADGDLTLSVEANTAYTMTSFIVLEGVANADAQLSYTFPVDGELLFGGSGVYYADADGSDAAAFGEFGAVHSEDGSTNALFYGTVPGFSNGGIYSAVMHKGLLVTDATAGSLTLLWAPLALTAWILRGSFIQLTRIP